MKEEFRCRKKTIKHYSCSISYYGHDGHLSMHSSSYPSVEDAELMASNMMKVPSVARYEIHEHNTEYEVCIECGNESNY